MVELDLPTTWGKKFSIAIRAINDEVEGQIGGSGGGMPHYEASWFGSFADAPDNELNVGGGTPFNVTLGAMNDNGNSGTTGIRSLSLPLGVYYISWGGYIGTPDDVPDPGDPQRFGVWKVSWDNSAANLGQFVAATAPVAMEAPNTIGGLFSATVSMVAAFTDEEDELSIQIDSPYGGVTTSIGAYLAITKIGGV